MIPLSDNIASRRIPYVTIAILIACIVVFVYEYLAPGFVQNFAFRPAYVLSTDLFRVGPGMALQTMILSMFMHGGLMHIGSNMLFLWVFGDNVEDRLGHFRFLVFYLVCGIVATLAHSLSAGFGLLYDPHSLDRAIVGASGAVAGVLGAYLVLFPQSSVRTLVIFFIITVINVPAIFFIVLWFITQLFSGVGSLAGAPGGVAYWAHIGGFVVGFVWGKMVANRPFRRPPPPRIMDLRMDD